MIEAFTEPFFLRALLAGLLVAIVAGSLGCFVVWRRMAYFGDSLAHSSLLGIAFGLTIGISPQLGTLLICILFALLLVWLQRKKILATDTLLGILAHAALSIGMVVVSLLDGVRIDLYSYLFGDILSVTSENILWMGIGGCIVLVTLWKMWSQLVLTTLHEDLARAEGIHTERVHLLFLSLMAMAVALSIQVVGILLITSMLIIPAATARQIARSPLQMAAFATIFGCLSVIFGLTASMLFDTPSGPTIVTAATALFCIVQILSISLKRA